ncbi:MAG: hypothetical protein ACI35W_01385 [Anaeroplasmataceae bacterium]
MEKIFKRIIATRITRSVLRILLGILSVVIGLVLAYVLDNYVYLIIGIIIAMFVSVIIIASSFGKDKYLLTLKNEAINRYLPYMKYLPNNKAITEIYNVFEYKSYGHVVEVFDAMQGNKGSIKIDSVSIKYHLNNSIRIKYIRLYKFTFDNECNVNLYSINHELFKNFRYEVKDNILYLSMFASRKHGVRMTFDPIYFKSYDEYIERYNKEDKLIKLIIRSNGGNNNEKYNN